MIVKRGSKSASRVKLTDGLINYSKSGKTNKPEWKQFNNILFTVDGILRDAELVGLQIVRVSADKLSFRYAHRVDGRRKNITLGQFPAITTTQARQLAKDKSLEVALGENPLDKKQAKRVSTENTLQAYIDHDYGLHMRGRASTAEKYLKIIENGFPKLLKKPLTEITKADLVKWLQYQMKQHNDGVKGFASATIQQRLSTLKTLMAHAVRNDMIERSPFDKLDKLEFTTTAEATEQQEKRTYLTLEQQAALLQSIDNYDDHVRAGIFNSRVNGVPNLTENTYASYHKPMMMLLYYMGIRMGDVVTLEWTHVIDTPFTCNITKVLQKTRRKIKKPFVMPMPEPIKVMLKEWRKQQGNPKRGFVFPGVDGKQLYDTPLVECWKWIKKDSDFHEELQMYSLRHNFTSWLIMNNVPLSVIAGMIGHTSTDMINRNYGHLIKGATETASKGFAELLDRKQA